MLCLQETRDRTSQHIVGRHILAYHSASQQGQGGCAIWVRRSLAGHSLNAKHVAVLDADSQHLVIRIQLGALNLLVATGHAPHSAMPDDVIQAWWQRFQQLLSKHRCDSDVVLLGLDANARLGSEESEAVGGHAAEVENLPGKMLRHFAAALNLWIPSTFFGAQRQLMHRDDEAYTWTSPCGGRHRLDYVLILARLQSVALAVVIDDLSADRAPDHRAACLDFCLDAGIQSCQPDFPRLPLRTVSEIHQHAPRLCTALRTAASLPWSLNVHQHAARIDAGVWRACRRKPRSFRPVKPYVCDSTQRLLQQAKGHVGALKGLDRACDRHFLATFFALWKGCHDSIVRAERAAHGTSIARARVVFALRKCRHSLRVSLTQDKRNYVCCMSDRFANAVSDKGQQALFQALQCLRPTPSKGRSKPWGGLAMLCDGEGRPTASYEGRQEILRQTFAAQKGGWQCTPEEYCRADAGRALGPGDTFSLADLPTLLQLEGIIHEMADGKAPGPSGIGPAPWKAFPPEAARALLPMCVKTHVRLCEPVQNRGTIVVGLFKMAGSICDPRNHRSIALLNP